MFVNKLFTYLTCAYLRSKRCFNVKTSTSYFHTKMKILVDFQICISVPLKTKTRTAKNTLISVFVTCVKAIIYLLLYHLHECTLKEKLNWCFFCYRHSL